MKYDFTKQANKQIELDNYIKENSKIESEQKYWEDRLIALNVELSEVSNEIRFFKYWSKKGPSKNEIIIDELVDCLHFAFSLGNTLKNENWIFLIDDIKRPIRMIYFDISKKIIELKENKDKDLFRNLLFNITELAFNMNYSMKDIEVAYDIKNQINYNRQKSGY